MSTHLDRDIKHASGYDEQIFKGNTIKAYNR